jgi:hypothetical protein
MMARHFRPILGLAVALTLGCHAIDRAKEAPETPSEPTAIAIPVVLPKASPKPTPTPAPNPSPEPTPTPTPPPSTGSCGLPPSNPSHPSCTDEGTRLLEEVDAALTAVTKKNPELFDFDNKKCENCYYVKNVDAYAAKVVKQLASQGICAIWDGEEIGAKKTNDYSEQFDIITASNYMRRGPGSYRGVCRPAIF